MKNQKKPFLLRANWWQSSGIVVAHYGLTSGKVVA